MKDYFYSKWLKQIYLPSFVIPVGAGMTATVYASLKHPNLILKKIKREECDAAEVEAKAGQRIYEAYREYVLCSKDKMSYSTIEVPQYIRFSRFNNALYGCDILMERIASVQHIALSDAILQKDREYGVQYGQPISSENPSRGFFASEITLSTQMPISEIVYSIGLLDGIILFGAGYIPIDVEYILSQGKVWAIDFGMLQPTDTSDIESTAQKYVDELDTSIYYVPVDQYKDDFIKGLSDALECFDTDYNQELLSNILVFIDEL